MSMYSAVTRTRSGRYFNGHTMHDRQRKEAFGLKSKNKWPKEGLPTRAVPNHWRDVTQNVRILPYDSTKYRYHRCQAQCHICGTWVCAGHIGQHVFSCQ